MGCHPNPIDFHSIIFQRVGGSTTNQNKIAWWIKIAVGDHTTWFTGEYDKP